MNKFTPLVTSFRLRRNENKANVDEKHCFSRRQRDTYRTEINSMLACCPDIENKGEIPLGQCAGNEDSVDSVSSDSNNIFAGPGVRLR